MQFSELTVKLIILFLPGIISTFVLQLFLNKGRLKDREFLIAVILNGFLSHYIYSFFAKDSSFFDSLFSMNGLLDQKSIIWASCISLVMGIVECYIANYDSLYRIGNLIRLTTKSGQISVWDELFDNHNKGINNFVYVTDRNKSIIYAGSVTNYSMSYSGKKEILLASVVVYDLKERDKELYSLKKLYLDLTDTNNIEIEIGDSYNGTKK